jgi:formylglycine-generating enzyme required for sulfatase activity
VQRLRNSVCSGEIRVENWNLKGFLTKMILKCPLRKEHPKVCEITMSVSIKDLKREIGIIKRDLPAFKEYKAERKGAGDTEGAYYWQTKIDESNKRLKEIEDFVNLYDAKISKPAKKAPSKKKAVKSR